MSTAATATRGVGVGAEVRAVGLGVRFDFDRHQRVITPALSLVRRRAQTVWALERIDLVVQPGEAVAVIGATGSGKTTLLRAVAGVVEADRGELRVQGRVGSLLSTEGGLMGALTGRENARLLGVLAGLPLATVNQRLDALAERSGLGAAFERPVATYSEGMRARLGFAAGTAAEPDVLVLDEVFEALDHEYRAVVEEYAHDLCARGGVVMAAGHDHEALARMCGRGIHLADGAVRADGAFGDVVAAYRA